MLGLCLLDPVALEVSLGQECQTCYVSTLSKYMSYLDPRVEDKEADCAWLFFFNILTSKIIIKKQQHNNKTLKVGTAISQTAAGVHRCTQGTCSLIARQDLGT